MIFSYDLANFFPDESNPPQRLLPVLERLKAAYLLWNGYYQKLPKTHRYTLGVRIDGLLVECIEAAASATFLERSAKAPWIRVAIRKLDTVKVLLMVLWETGSLETKRYAALSLPLEDAGKQFGGWYGKVASQNERPPSGGRSK